VDGTFSAVPAVSGLALATAAISGGVSESDALTGTSGADVLAWVSGNPNGAGGKTVVSPFV